MFPSGVAFEIQAWHAHAASILHFSNGADSLLLFRGERLSQHQRDPLAGRNFQIVLIKAAMNKRDDASIGLAAAFPHFHHFGLHANCIAVEKRLWKSHFVPAEIGDRGAKRRVSNRNSDHHA